MTWLRQHFTGQGGIFALVAGMAVVMWLNQREYPAEECQLRVLPDKLGAVMVRGPDGIGVRIHQIGEVPCRWSGRPVRIMDIRGTWEKTMVPLLDPKRQTEVEIPR